MVEDLKIYCQHTFYNWKSLEGEVVPLMSVSNHDFVSCILSKLRAVS